MGERPLVWVQVMPLAAPEMGSKAEAGLAARKYDGNLPPGQMVCAQAASGSSETPVSRKRRREIAFGLELGFPGFGKV